MNRQAPGTTWGPSDSERSRATPQTVRHAASLVLATRPTDNDDWRFLMGRRAASQTFLAGYFVFPGGRLEATDKPISPSPLPETDAAKMAACSGSRGTLRLGHRLAACALRETREETGFDLATTGLALRYLARAVTPPRTIRRYDTRFFIGRISDPDLAARVAHDLPDGELDEIGWYRATDLPERAVMRITSLILDHAFGRLASDPDLSDVRQVPCHRFVAGKPVVIME